MQRSPAEPYAAETAASAAMSMSASGQHDHVVLRAAERLAALPVRRRRLVDVPGDRRRADERDRAMSGCSSSASTATLSPLTTLKTPSGTPASLEQLGGVERRRRVLLRRLQDERVAAGERGRPHPHRDHRGEVERRDAGDDAERLADRVDVDPRRGLLGHAALQQMRDAAAELDHLEPARHLAHRVGEHLAVLGASGAARSPRGCAWKSSRIAKKSSARFASDSARHAGNACFAAWTARSTSSRRREVDGARLLARRRVVDRAGRPDCAGVRACRRSSG